MSKSNKKRTAWSFVLQCFYPRRCPVCDGVLFFSDKFWIHPECRKKLSFVRQPFCFRCGRALSDPSEEYCPDCRRRRRSFARSVSALEYNEAARDSVVRFKYHGRQQYAVSYAEEIWAIRSEEILSFKADALVPVPIHRARLLKRGYNQAELLAVILVDDIFTTGSTMEACTRVLLAAGVPTVFGVTLCVGMGEE